MLDTVIWRWLKQLIASFPLAIILMDLFHILKEGKKKQFLNVCPCHHLLGFLLKSKDEWIPWDDLVPSLCWLNLKDMVSAVTIGTKILEHMFYTWIFLQILCWAMCVGTKCLKTRSLPSDPCNKSCGTLKRLGKVGGWELQKAWGYTVWHTVCAQ